MTSTPTRARATLTGISSRAWEHPADRGALVALRKLRGFDTVLKALSGFMNERKVRLDFIGGGIRVDERQFAGVQRVLAEVGRVLDVAELPEVFVVNDPTTNEVRALRRPRRAAGHPGPSRGLPGAHEAGQRLR